MALVDAPEVKWAVTSRAGKKRIHRSDCKYAKNAYVWAGARSERELFDALVESGAARWHDAGHCCSEDLDWALYWVTRNDVPGDIDRYIGRLETSEPAR